MNMSFGADHIHRFSSPDADGNITCRRCGAILMSCRSCPVGFCVIRNYLERGASNPEVNIFMPNCPVASQNYRVLYKRVPV